MRSRRASIFDELETITIVAFAGGDSDSWKCETCIASGQQQQRGCGVKFEKPFAEIDGIHPIHSCPTAASAKARLLFDYFSGIQAGMLMPMLMPSVAEGKALRVFGSAAARVMKAKAKAKAAGNKN